MVNEIALCFLSTDAPKPPLYISSKIEKVHGEYTYHVPDNVSLEEGKRTALERAKIQALADAFGTLVSQNNSTIVKNEMEIIR